MARFCLSEAQGAGAMCQVVGGMQADSPSGPRPGGVGRIGHTARHGTSWVGRRKGTMAQAGGWRETGKERGVGWCATYSNRNLFRAGALQECVMGAQTAAGRRLAKCGLFQSGSRRQQQQIGSRAGKRATR